MNKTVVIFVTNVFENAKNGPAVYAQNLWKFLESDPRLEFHVVAPKVLETHPRLHEAGVSTRSLTQYRLLADTTRSLAHSLITRNPIIHCNSPHSIGGLLSLPFPLLIQANDYLSATIFDHPLKVLRDVGFSRFFSLAWRRSQERDAMKKATLVLCNSAYTRKILVRKYGLAWSKTDVLYKSIDSQHFGQRDCLPVPFDAMRNLPHGKRIVFVGSDWYQKGLDILLEAFMMVRERHPEASLVVVGEPNTVPPGISKLVAKASKDSSKVCFLGRLDRQQLISVFRQCDLCVQPSRQEALGVSILEAVFLGLPVIASHVGGIPEILEKIDSSTTVASECPNKLGEQIDYYFSNRVEPETLLKDVETIRTNFGVDTMIADLVAIYRGTSKPQKKNNY